jgi:hypothetical protein
VRLPAGADVATLPVALVTEPATALAELAAAALVKARGQTAIIASGRPL